MSELENLWLFARAIAKAAVMTGIAPGILLLWIRERVPLAIRTRARVIAFPAPSRVNHERKKSA